MLIRYGYEITVDCPQDTPMVCLLAAHAENAQRVRAAEKVVATPDVPMTVYTDLYGNLCRRFVAPAGQFTLWGDGVMEDSGLPDVVVPEAQEVAVADLPDECLVYLMGSRYCETDRLSQVAWDLFGNVAPGWGRVQAICDYANRHIRFDYQQARATRTAYEGWQEQVGVCRDYAHLAIALCRCMNIPARYVNGHLGDIGVPILSPMDYSAWMEVFLSGRWWTFDPRNNVPRIGRIVVARGRDAADVPLINSFGQHLLNGFRVWTYPVESV